MGEMLDRLAKNETDQTTCSSLLKSPLLSLRIFTTQEEDAPMLRKVLKQRNVKVLAGALQDIVLLPLTHHLN